MSIAFFLDGALLPYQSVRFPGSPSGGVQGLPMTAWYGEPTIAGIVVDDPEGSLDIDGWHEFWVNETACSKPRIFTGWIFGRTISRGPYVNGAGRVWDCDIVDLNAAFSLVAFRAKSAQRPAETDLVRVAFAQASGPMSFTPLNDNGRFNTTDNPVSFGDSNYVTQFPAELFTSVSGVAGKNFYAYFDNATGEASLHYDLFNEGPAATIAVSNVHGDADQVTTFFPSIDAQLARTPLEQYTGVLLGWRGGYVYDTRQATIDDIGPSVLSPGGFQRDLVHRTDRIGRLETANTVLADMLLAHSVERDTLLFTVRLPAASVNLVEAGELLTVRFQHLPGYESDTEVVVIRRVVVPTPGTDDQYDVNIEARRTGLSRGPGGGDPGELPRVDACDASSISLLQSSSVNVSTSTHQFTIPTPTDGALIVLDVGQRESGTQTVTVDDFNEATSGPVTDADQDFAYRKWYRTVPSGWDGVVQLDVDGTNNEIRVLYAEFAGGGTFDSVGIDNTTADNPATITCGSVTPPTGSVALIVGGSVCGLNVTDPFSGAALGDSIELEDEDGGSRVPMWSGYQIVDGASGSYSIDYDPTFGGIIRGTIGATAAFICTRSDPDSPCLDTGQPSVEDEPATPATGDGTTTTFETACPFADESLRVKVDDLDQTAAITSYDGAAGTFTLGYAPVAGEQITVNYLGR